MKIYTKTGDSGSTSLFGGKRVKKNNLRLQAYGDVDELNSVLGLILAQLQQHSNLEFNAAKSLLTDVQIELFNIGSHLATDKPALIKKLPKLNTGLLQQLEQNIDSMEESLTPLKNFILPGGHLLSAQTHVARTVTRRAERSVVDLAQKTKVHPNVVIFLNRLSDYLFVLARYFNFCFQVSETAWVPR